MSLLTVVDEDVREGGGLFVVVLQREMKDFILAESFDLWSQTSMATSVSLALVG